jgi:hypothetical protein
VGRPVSLDDAGRLARVVRLAPMAVLLAGCCARPSGPWDRPAFAWRDSSPGVVLVVDRARKLAVCTGTVVRSELAGEGFRSYVLTAAHCVDDDEHPHRWGVAAPGPAETHLPLAAGWLPLYGVPVLEATRVLVSPPRAKGLLGVDVGGPVEWVDDWAILTVDTPHALPVVQLSPGDPVSALAPGAAVSLLAYHDGAFHDRYGPFLQAHEHPFAWTGVPPDVAQPGHSGAPIVHDGEIVAILSGYGTNSFMCQLLCWSTWQTKLELVNVATIRREAAAHGLAL